MNHFLTFLIIGIIIGAIAAGIWLTNDVIPDHMGERDGSQPERRMQPNPDTDLLDFLEATEHSLFFNPGVEMWGLVDDKNKMVAAGYSVRSTIHGAREKEREIERAEQAENDEIGRRKLMEALDPALGEMSVHP